MKVRILETGEVTHALNQMAALMIKLRIWEEVIDPPAPVQAKWFLFTEQLGDGANLNSANLGFKCGACNSVFYFIPDVNLSVAKIIEAARPHCVHRTPCPPELAEAYVAAGGGQPLPKYEFDCKAVNAAQAASLANPKTF